LLLSVSVDKELVVQLLGVLLEVLVLFGDRPLLPVFMGRGLHLVVLQLILSLWELRLPGLARAMILVFMPVLVGTYMRLVVALLQVLVGDWLVLQELVGKGLTMVTVMIMMQRLVLVGKMLFMVDRYLRLGHHGTRACANVWRTLVTDAGVSQWQTARIGNGGRHVRGGNNVSVWRVPTDGVCLPMGSVFLGRAGPECIGCCVPVAKGVLHLRPV
jgi:hypothetical protein